MTTVLTGELLWQLRELPRNGKRYPRFNEKALRDVGFLLGIPASAKSRDMVFQWLNKNHPGWRGRYIFHKTTGEIVG
jgi:hypothetical protein